MFAKKNLSPVFAAGVFMLTLQSCNMGSYPTTAQEWDKQACLHYQRGEYNLATNDWDQAVKLEPDNPVYIWKRSRATMRFDRLQQSIDDAKKAIELLGDKDPRMLIYYELQLAEAYAVKGAFAESKEAFAKALEMAQGKVDAAPIYMERGRMLLSVGDLDGAIADMDSAIAIVPTLGRAYHYRGKAHDLAGNPSAAAKDFAKARSMNFELAEESTWEPLPIN